MYIYIHVYVLVITHPGELYLIYGPLASCLYIRYSPTGVLLLLLGGSILCKLRHTSCHGYLFCIISVSQSLA